jgi:hypothetical protein
LIAPVLDDHSIGRQWGKDQEEKNELFHGTSENLDYFKHRFQSIDRANHSKSIFINKLINFYPIDHPDLQDFPTVRFLDRGAVTKCDRRRGGIWTQRATRIAGSRHHGFPRLPVQQQLGARQTSSSPQRALDALKGFAATCWEPRGATFEYCADDTYMTEDPKAIDRALNLIMAARALERAADHAKNTSDT